MLHFRYKSVITWFFSFLEELLIAAKMVKKHYLVILMEKVAFSTNFDMMKTIVGIIRHWMCVVCWTSCHIWNVMLLNQPRGCFINLVYKDYSDCLSKIGVYIPSQHYKFLIFPSPIGSGNIEFIMSRRNINPYFGQKSE